MSPVFTLRRGTPADSASVFEIFVASARDLTARQGNPWQPDAAAMWTRLEPLLAHLAVHAAEWWIAEDPSSHEPIGYARSVERDGLFELSEFFVHPDRQSAGVGAALLEKAFPLGRGDVRAIIATTDVRAQARYYRAGTVARFPIASLQGAPRAIEAEPGIEAASVGPGDLPTLVEIDAAVLEFDRGAEFAWLIEHREGYIYRRSGAPIGFAFVSVSGSGPIASLVPEDQVSLLDHIETRAAELGIETLSYEVPMVNEVAMRHLLARGFRIDPFLTVLMASRPFGSFDRYIGFSPPFVL